MNEHISNILKSREEFLTHLENDIIKSDELIETISQERKGLEELITNVQSLKTYPEHEALIPLGKRIYVKGKIIHTGEYHLRLDAHPNSYVLLQGADQTLNTLKERIKLKDTDIERAKYAKYQLEERKTLFEGDYGGVLSTEGPKEIHSDKGVAVKVGEFYEILEYED